MQMNVGTVSVLMVMAALFIQMIWLGLARASRNRYLRDLAAFRSPKSIFSRFYHWRSEKVRNVIIEAVCIELGILIGIILISVPFLPIAGFEALLPVILFIVVISSLSSAQGVYHAQGLRKIEAAFLQTLTSSDDKIGTSRRLVIPLIGSYGQETGKQWFALYRISQRQDPIGWALRDVLMDKGIREMVQRTAKNQTVEGMLSSDDGPSLT